jgi:hypothetical protein
MYPTPLISLLIVVVAILLVGVATVLAAVTLRRLIRDDITTQVEAARDQILERLGVTDSEIAAGRVEAQVAADVDDKNHVATREYIGDALTTTLQALAKPAAAKPRSRTAKAGSANLSAVPADGAEAKPAPKATPRRSSSRSGG